MHFTNLTNVNPLETNRIQYWILPDISTNQRVFLEKAFINKFQPKFNLSKEDIEAKNQEWNVKLPSEKESFNIFLELPQQSRLDLLVRIKNKAKFILDLSHQFEMLGITTKGKRLLIKHSQDLYNFINEI